ncbi:acyl-CoA dehydrogenase family protein [Spongiibacter sp.]|uniref:acyl-CoA dehydrogenase family protein n=1 Tax=Spongiibacter sp. TaxID=2024860 RepID=UPI003566DED7
MDFSLSEEQQLLKDSVDKYIAERYDYETRRGYLAEAQGFSAAVWRDFAELGWLTVPLPESFGGFGGSVVDTAVLFEAFGRGLVVEPYLATVLLAGQLIARGDNEALKAQWLEPIMAGQSQAAFAYLERHSRFDLDQINCRAERDGQGYRLSGHKALVLNGMAADVLLVSARSDDGIELFALPSTAPGVTRRGFVLMDGQPVANIELDNVAVEAGAKVCASGEALALMRAVVDEATVAIAAQAVGAMEYLVKATADYANTRKQFGQPIGKFQALQHRMVDMYMATEQCRSLLVRALCSVAEREEQAPQDIAALKAMVGKYGRSVAEEAVQLHGGMGVTEELNIGGYLKRLMVIDSLFGDSRWQRKRFTEMRYSSTAA